MVVAASSATPTLPGKILLVCWVYLLGALAKKVKLGLQSCSGCCVDCYLFHLLVDNKNNFNYFNYLINEQIIRKHGSH
jgi:hypothetical protein